MKAYTEIKGKVCNRSFDPAFDEKFYKALDGLKENMSNREKLIMDNVKDIVIDEGDDYLLAEVYDVKGNSFDFIIEDEHRKPGHISG